MPSARGAPSSGANRVRIIGGAWRSRVIRFAAHAAVRPTPDRVRETLFNWLGPDLSGTVCLDLYAGSGALGFEAASRGARRVVMVERDPAVFRTLESTRAVLGASAVELVRADAIEFVNRDGGRYDIVFLDPPFEAANWPQLLQPLPARLNRGGVVYCESAAPFELPAGWRVRKRGRAGHVSYQLLQRADDE